MKSDLFKARKEVKSGRKIASFFTGIVFCTLLWVMSWTAQVYAETPVQTWEIGRNTASDVVASLYYYNGTDDVDGYRLEIVGTGSIKNFSYQGNVDWKDYKDKIVKVVVSDGITTIPEYSFYKCKSLTDLSLPDTITTFGASAFEGCSGVDIASWPANLKNIYGRVFFGCTSLTNGNFPEGVTTIYSGAFSGCTGITNVVIPSTVTTLGQMSTSPVFSGRNMETITLNNVVLASDSSLPMVCRRSDNTEISTLKAGVLYNEVLTKQPLTVITNPENVEAITGDSVIFSITGMGVTAYKWQFSTDNNTWNNINGATADSYELSSVKNENVGYYRCYLQAKSGETAYSESAQLTIKSYGGTATTDEESPMYMQVTATVESSYIVKIPALIALSDDDGDGTFTGSDKVGCKGGIPAAKKVVCLVLGEDKDGNANMPNVFYIQNTGTGEKFNAGAYLEKSIFVKTANDPTTETEITKDEFAEVPLNVNVALADAGDYIGNVTISFSLSDR